MSARTSLKEHLGTVFALIATTVVVFGQQTVQDQPTKVMPLPVVASTEAAEAAVSLSSAEQGRTPLDEAFDWQAWRLEKRREALKDTKVTFNLRSMYMDRNKFDGTESEAWAVGGWAGVKTGYFLDHIALGLTGYTSQPLYAPEDKDGTSLLATGQDGYAAFGELYTDIRIIDGLNLFVGRKEFDTPFINRNDTRMTPNTFEAVALQGRAELGDDRAVIKYGVGYFDSIKERNSDEFVSMSVDAGATAERGVFTAGGLYQKGNFSLGAIDYYCADIINIGYVEAKVECPLGDDLKLRFAAQYADQRSVGSALLPGGDFWARQFGLKAELPVGSALYSVAYTSANGDANMQNPWSGYPGYTGVQVQDFNREGESAVLLRAAYEFTSIKGLSTYALAVFGTEPNAPGQYGQDEYDLNLQWLAPAGTFEGLSLRVRYAFVDQRGGAADNLTDFRVMCNYVIDF